MSPLSNLSEALFNQFLYIWLAICVVSALSLFFGRFMPMSSRETQSGLEVLGRIDKKLGWVILETPILITVGYFFITGMQASGNPLNVSAIFTAAFFAHYFYRALIYPQRIKVNGKTMPVMIMLFAMIFYIVNGYMIGHYFGALRIYPIEWLWDPRFLIGATMFFVGFAVNIHSDNILIRLRKPGETGYKIPRGGMYRYVSCPNYMGETLEWIGFAIMSWSLVGAVFALWVALPLLAQAMNAHRWYQREFGDEYPTERKAIIPFLL